MRSPLQILFVDDHIGFRDGMMYMLKTKNPGFEITGASDMAEAVGILKSGTEIDIVILDINLDGENSLDAVPKFREAKPDVKIIVYTMYNDEFHIKQALLAEVHGFVTKEMPIEELEKAVVAVADGKSYFGSAAEKDRQALFPGKQNYNAADEKSYLFECYDSLGKKEREVFILFCSDFTASCVAVNYFGAFLAARTAFPLYLDSILTIAVTAVCGLVPGIVCATATNLLSYFFVPNMGILFVLSHISTAVSAELFFRHERKNMHENGRRFSYSTETFMWAGLVAGLTNSVLGNTFSYLFYPALKIPQAGTAVQEIYVVTRRLLFANYFGGTITNLIDKIISATVSLFVYRLVQRIKRRITMGGRYRLN